MFHSFKNLFRSSAVTASHRRVYYTKRLRLEMLLDRIMPDVTPIGTEFQVNTIAEGSQNSPSVARDRDGNFVVVWASEQGGGSILAQRFDPNGNTAGPEFQVDTLMDGGALDPDVSMSNVEASNGQFIVVWEDASSQNHLIYSRRFESDGTPLDSEDVQVNENSEATAQDPSVAMDPNGNFAVSWTFGFDSEIHARHFDAAWNMYSSEFQVDSNDISNFMSSSSVAIDQGGNFLVVWDTEISVGGIGKRDINGHFFNSSGQSIFGTDFKVNADIPVPTPLIDGNPSVAMSAEGFFVVAWESSTGGLMSPPPDGDGLAILSRRFKPDGSPLDVNDVLVNTFAEGNQYSPSAAMSADGKHVISWVSGDDQTTQDGDLAGVFGQAYSADGAPNGPEFQVNTTTLGNQLWPAVAMDFDGNFVVVWMSQDQDGDGIFAQMYGF